MRERHESQNAALDAALREQLRSFRTGRVTYILPRDSQRDSLPRKDSTNSNWWRPHNHRYAEVLQLLAGDATLDLSTRVLRLKSGVSYVIPPGVMHEERAADGRKPYSVLWTSVGMASVKWFISTRGPGGAVTQIPARVPDRTLYRSEELVEFARNLRPGNLGGPVSEALCLATLIRACVGALRREGLGLDRQDYHETLAQEVAAYLDHHYRERVTVAELAKLMQCTPNHLNTVFRRTMGRPVHRYLMDRRMAEAEDLLGSGALPVKCVAYESGFQDPLYFSRVFRRRTGVSPTAYRLRKG